MKTGTLVRYIHDKNRIGLIIGQHPHHDRHYHVLWHDDSEAHILDSDLEVLCA